jgi:hypothetical protein
MVARGGALIGDILRVRREVVNPLSVCVFGTVLIGILEWRGRFFPGALGIFLIIAASVGSGSP